MSAMRVVTAKQMKEIERRAAEGGLGYRAMMENAGAAAARVILSAYSPREAVVFAGRGNNGGDGFVVARLLCEKGVSVSVVLVGGEPGTPDAIHNRERLRSLPIRELPLEGEALRKAISCAQVIIDAVYGTGFHGALDERARAAARMMNEAAVPVAALDLPSGVNADSGEAAPGAVRAEKTVAFDSLKHAHMLAAGHCGEVLCEDIGIPEGCHAVS